MKTYEEILEADIRDGIIHGAAVLAGTLEGNFCDRSFGFAENTLTSPMNSQSVIDVASVTKAAATVSALLVCHSRGLIDFDAPFTEYLSGYKPSLSTPVRIRDLANHRSGFGDVPGQSCRLYFNESGTEMLRNMLTIPPPFPPGNLSYACWNYILLAMILEQVTGKRFSDFCREEVFLPLGMRDTSLGKPVDLPEERIAQTICTEKPGQISDFVAFRIYRDGGCTGNAGLFSTASDLARLLRCCLRHGEYENGRLFSEESFREIEPDRREKYDGYRRFGWIIYDSLMSDSEFGTSLLHSGWSGQTVFMNFAKQMFAIVLTTRCGDYDRAKADRFEVIRQLYEQTPQQ